MGASCMCKCVSIIITRDQQTCTGPQSDVVLLPVIGICNRICICLSTMHTCRLDVVMCGCESSKCATRIQKKAIYRFWRKNADSYEVLLTAKSHLTHKNSNNYVSFCTIHYIGSIVLK